MMVVIIYSRKILLPQSIPIANFNHISDRQTLRAMY